MNAIVEETIPFFLKAIIALLKTYANDIKEHYPMDHRGLLPLNGVELYLSREYSYFYLSFRSTIRNLRSRKGHDSRADENEYGLQGPSWYKEVPEQNVAVQHMKSINEQIGSSKVKSSCINHLLFLSAAEALIHPDFTKELVELKINAPLVENSFLHDDFEYMVFDENASTIVNYCEHILLNRITAKCKNA